MITADQLTRGRRALIAWIAMTALLLGLFVAVRLGASGGLDEQIDGAQVRAVTHAAAISGVVAPKPGTADLAFNRRELATLVQAEVFDDPTVARVRLYGVDGVLLFATDQDVGPGDVPAPSEDPGVISAASGTSYRSIVDTEFTWSTVGAPGTTTELLQVFEPLHTVDRFSSVGVVQVDSFMDDLRSEALGERDLALTVIAVLALLSLAATVITFRRTSSSEGDGSEAEATHEDPQAAASALRTKLKTAEGRRVKAERSAEEAKKELAAAQGSVTAAQERAETLESELAAAVAAAGAASAAAPVPKPGPTPEMRQEMEELRRQLSEAEVRVTEAAAAAAAARAESETAHTDAETARKDAETARKDAETARKDAETARKDAETAKSAAAPAPVVAQAVDPSTEHLERLEERIVAAEQRAREAEERIDRIAPLSEEASDLRTRLAKTAARKRLGPSSDGED